MANHVKLKTKRAMTPSEISKIIEDLNKTVFREVCTISYHKATEGEPGWGEHAWLINVLADGEQYGSRVCWLNSSKSFEMRHGGGTDFMWWIDRTIVHHVAAKFGGNPVDDGDGEKQKVEPNKFPTFEDYCKIVWRFPNSKYSPEQQDLLIRYRMQEEQEWIPKVHRFDTGKHITSTQQGNTFTFTFQEDQ